MVEGLVFESAEEFLYRRAARANLFFDINPKGGSHCKSLSSQTNGNGIRDWDAREVRVGEHDSCHFEAAVGELDVRVHAYD